MRCKYPERDLSQRLDGTICRYKGFPYYVRFGGDKSFFLYKLTNTRSKTYDLIIKADDVDFDISTIPLGYCQWDKYNVAYISRKPHRLYKQGVSPDNIVATNTNNQKINVSIFTLPFEEMVINKYKKLDQVFKEFKNIEEISAEFAIHRNIALKLIPKIRIIEVFFKQEKVGWINEGTNTVIVTALEKGWIVSKYLSEFDWKVE